MISIEDTNGHRASSFSLFNLGFRPFFLGAAVFAVVSMILWAGIYNYGWQPMLSGIPSVTWHAHEMIYGYSLAVIAGFLLTAVKNWTGVQTAYGMRLFLLFSFWVLARIVAAVDTPVTAQIMFLLDMAFVVFLLFELSKPIVKARNWQQLGILSIAILLGAGNLLFYIGFFGGLTQGIQWGLYAGLYLVIGLIIIMGRRVISFFIERGVGYQVELKNWRVLDIASVVLFLLFFVFAVFTPYNIVSAGVALVLFALLCIRLWGWYTPGIWKKPLLWSLFCAYAFIACGFLLYAVSTFFTISAFLSVHAFAFGGIGLMTFSMMARVSLGHTGRNVQQAPKVLLWPLVLLLVGACLRVFPLLITATNYSLWILFSQILWIISFSIFVYVYTPILVKPRLDGRPG